MRAWLMHGYEGVERLQLSEVPDRAPGAGEVLLRVRFASINPADAFLSRGMYPAKPPMPHILGRDGVGDVLAVGEGVENIQPGQTLGILRCDVGVKDWGTLAETVVAPANSLAPVPAGWTLEEMAAAPLTFLTAWQALTQWSDPPAPPKAGSSVLVSGASGGVGVATLLLGKSMGLTMIAVSRSEPKRERLRQLGADFAFDAVDPELRKQKVNLAVDNIGGPFFSQLVAMLAYRGCISVVGRSAGPVPEFNTGTLFFKRNRVGGVSVGDFSAAEAQVAWKEIVARLASIGRTPVVDTLFDFEEVPQAFQRLAEGPMGKVVLRIAG
jgi:NADPH2:quinone reductase